MTETLDFESNAFAELLTDALRSGPGSPQWHEALAALRLPEHAEYERAVRAIIQAREHLESGRDYRSIRAGDGFTKRLMAEIDSNGSGDRAKRLPSTLAIAGVAGLLVVIGIVGISYYLSGGKAPYSGDPAAMLSNLNLMDPVVVLGSGEPSPSDWTVIGRLPMNFAQDIKLASGGATAPTASDGGPEAVTGGAGLVWNGTMAAGSPFAVEAVIRLGRATDQVIPQLVITDVNDFDPDGATGSSELVCLMQNGRAIVVLPNGHVAAQSPRLKELNQPLTLRVAVDRDNALVEVGGREIWVGRHGLTPDRPRYVAVRLLTRGQERPEPVTIQSVRIHKGRGG